MFRKGIMGRIFLSVASVAGLIFFWQNCSIPQIPNSQNSPSNIASLPPFDHFRTEFNFANEGTVANPLELDTCKLLPVKDWQVGVCSNIASLPRAYPGANSFNLEKGYTRYWVLSVNDEPAFQATNLGPPDQSLPVNEGPVWVIAKPKGIQLGLSNQHLSGASTPGGIPFVSYGLQMGRGMDDPVLPNARYRVSFDVTLDDIMEDPAVANSIHFFIETQSSGQRLFSWLFLGEKLTSTIYRWNWNWPIKESMWYPGAVIDMDVAANYSNHCGVSYPQIALNSSSKGVKFHYDIDLQNLVTCLSGISPDSPITGLHFAIEQNTPSMNYMFVTFENISISPN